ncbi:hypothetical protein MPPM_4000 [Methylorubrum populi]|uniref:Uncharacterized protein n=2 Tax=Methylorubrum populi TaxID=223967 RepID=A0A160PID2_9HYPH|nr:hypothetical protein MPPM_4000 [Methylorubrum populi]
MSSPNAAELRAIADKGSEATSLRAQEMSAAETVALPASGSDRKTGKDSLISTTTSTAVGAERKGGAADAKVSVSGTAGTAASSSEAGLLPAAASNAPRSDHRTFIGQPTPRDSAEIGLGSVVLAHEGPDEGWREAEVIGINGRVFSLRWRDYPTQPTILRTTTELALLPPGEA